MATTTRRAQKSYYCDDCGGYSGTLEVEKHEVSDCILHLRKIIDGDSYAQEFHWNRSIDGDEG